MSEKYQLLIMPEAQQDIRSIIHYIAGELSAPQAALNLQDKFQEGIRSLVNNPKRVKTVDEQPWKDAGIRRIREKNYYIYFLADDMEKTVKILGVIYVGRNQEKQMFGRHMETM